MTLPITPLSLALGEVTLENGPCQARLFVSGATVTLPLPVSVPGQTHLHLSAARSNLWADRDFLAFSGGLGTLETVLPPVAGEGFLSIPFTLRNGESVEGVFTILAIWDSAGSAQTLAQTTLILPADGSAQGTVVPYLAKGSGTLKLVLNGKVALSQTVTVLPRQAAELSLTPVTPAEAGPSPWPLSPWQVAQLAW